MSLTKHGITVACEGCRYVSRDIPDTFDVTVPIDDSETGTQGIATLRCAVSATGHRVELAAWTDTADRPMQPPAELQQRLSDTLEFVAEHRLCGNRHLCPAAVVEIVKTRIGG